MTISEVLARLDGLKHNTYTDAEKIAWLSRLDGIVKVNILDAYVGEEIEYNGYHADTDRNTELLVPAPFAEGVYIHWLAAQIDLANGEYDNYNAEIQTYNTEYQEFANWYNRTHLSRNKRQRFLF